MNTSQRVRVLLINDYLIVRTGLRMIVESDPSLIVVGEASNRVQAAAAAQQTRPDVVLLDVDHGTERVPDFLKDLHACAPQARILVLTAVRDLTVHAEAVRLGARGVLLKEEAAGTLLKAIRKVYEGELWLERTLTAELIAALTDSSHKALSPQQARIATLTPREREVIGLVTRGCRNRQVAEQLFISETTVRHHLTAIFAKLEVSDRLALVLYALQNGLVEADQQL